MKPTIGIIGTQELSQLGVPSQRVAETYPRVVADRLGGLPLIIPSIPEAIDIAALLDVLDGIILTGARPNVHPSLYGAAETEGHGPFDRNRDGVALPLVRAAVERDVPIFGICRGFQEMNVAFGGTLHPEIRDLPGRMNHRMPKGETDRAVIMALRHDVHLLPGGVFAGLYGAETIRVNSLHGQGIIDPGDRIVIEGHAEDTTPEALRIDGARFALAVQWHAEHDPDEQPVNAVLWQAFDAAIRQTSS